MSDYVSRARRFVGADAVEDVALAAAVLVIALHAVAQTPDSSRGVVVHVIESAAIAVAISLRRKRLSAAVVLAISAAALDALTVGPIRNDGVLYATLVLSYTLGTRRSGTTVRLWVACGCVDFALVLSRLPAVTASDYAFEAIAFGAAFGLGRLLQAREERAARTERLSLQVETERAIAFAHAVAAEREHIAREVHEVVTRSVGEIVRNTTEVDVRLEPARARERAALVALRHAGSEALAEMGRLVGFLSEEPYRPDSARPRLDQLEVLVERVERAGLRVQLSIRGVRRALPAELESTAFRIIQEGLTNSLKHAGGVSVRVSLTFASDVLSIELEDDGPVDSARPGMGGFGLTGMRERAALHHGVLVAGPAEHGGFAIRAQLPIAVPAALESAVPGSNQA